MWLFSSSIYSYELLICKNAWSLSSIIVNRVLISPGPGESCYNSPLCCSLYSLALKFLCNLMTIGIIRLEQGYFLFSLSLSPYYSSNLIFFLTSSFNIAICPCSSNVSIFAITSSSVCALSSSCNLKFSLFYLSIISYSFLGSEHKYVIYI